MRRDSLTKTTLGSPYLPTVPVLRTKSQRVYSDGDVIFKEGDPITPDSQMVIIKSGAARIRCCGINVAMAKAGDILGENVLLGKRRTADVIAIGTVECLVMNAKTFMADEEAQAYVAAKHERLREKNAAKRIQRSYRESTSYHLRMINEAALKRFDGKTVLTFSFMILAPVLLCCPMILIPLDGADMNQTTSNSSSNWLFSYVVFSVYLLFYCFFIIALFRPIFPIDIGAALMYIAAVFACGLFASFAIREIPSSNATVLDLSVSWNAILLLMNTPLLAVFWQVYRERAQHKRQAAEGAEVDKGPVPADQVQDAVSASATFSEWQASPHATKHGGSFSGAGRGGADALVDDNDGGFGGGGGGGGGVRKAVLELGSQGRPPSARTLIVADAADRFAFAAHHRTYLQREAFKKLSDSAVARRHEAGFWGVVTLGVFFLTQCLCQLFVQYFVAGMSKTRLADPDGGLSGERVLAWTPYYVFWMLFVFRYGMCAMKQLAKVLARKLDMVWISHERRHIVARHRFRFLNRIEIVFVLLEWVYFYSLFIRMQGWWDFFAFTAASMLFKILCDAVQMHGPLYIWLRNQLAPAAITLHLNQLHHNQQHVFSAPSPSSASSPSPSASAPASASASPSQGKGKDKDEGAAAPPVSMLDAQLARSGSAVFVRIFESARRCSGTCALVPGTRSLVYKCVACNGAMGESALTSLIGKHLFHVKLSEDISDAEAKASLERKKGAFEEVEEVEGGEKRDRALGGQLLKKWKRGVGYRYAWCVADSAVAARAGGGGGGGGTAVLKSIEESSSPIAIEGSSMWSERVWAATANAAETGPAASSGSGGSDGNVVSQLSEPSQWFTTSVTVAISDDAPAAVAAVTGDDIDVIVAEVPTAAGGAAGARPAVGTLASAGAGAGVGVGAAEEEVPEVQWSRQVQACYMASVKLAAAGLTEPNQLLQLEGVVFRRFLSSLCETITGIQFLVFLAFFTYGWNGEHYLPGGLDDLGGAGGSSTDEKAHFRKVLGWVLISVVVEMAQVAVHWGLFVVLSHQSFSPLRIFNELFIPVGDSDRAHARRMKRADSVPGAGLLRGEKGKGASDGASDGPEESSEVAQMLSKLRQAQRHHRAQDQGMLLSFIIFATFINSHAQFLISAKSLCDGAQLGILNSSLFNATDSPILGAVP